MADMWHIWFGTACCIGGSILLIICSILSSVSFDVFLSSSFPQISLFASDILLFASLFTIASDDIDSSLFVQSISNIVSSIVSPSFMLYSLIFCPFFRTLPVLTRCCCSFGIFVFSSNCCIMCPTIFSGVHLTLIVFPVIVFKYTVIHSFSRHLPLITRSCCSDGIFVFLSDCCIMCPSCFFGASLTLIVFPLIAFAYTFCPLLLSSALLVLEVPT